MPTIQTTVISASLTAPPAPRRAPSAPSPSRVARVPPRRTSPKRRSMIARRASRHNSSRKREVVQRQQPQSEQLVLRHEVAQVGAREARAGRARAALLQRALVAGEARVAEIEPPVPCRRRARAAEPRGQHAVEHVDAGADHAQDALGVADAHEVARPRRPAAARRWRPVTSNISSRSSPTLSPPIA